MRSGSPSGVVPRPRLSLDEQLDEYRAIVTTVLANHRKLPLQDRCLCGEVWPCPNEELAAQLLDWM